MPILNEKQKLMRRIQQSCQKRAELYQETHGRKAVRHPLTSNPTVPKGGAVAGVFVTDLTISE